MALLCNWRDYLVSTSLSWGSLAEKAKQLLGFPELICAIFDIHVNYKLQILDPGHAVQW